MDLESEITSVRQIVGEIQRERRGAVPVSRDSFALLSERMNDVVVRVNEKLDVSLHPRAITESDFSFSGNFTPSTINLQDIACVQVDGSPWLASGKGATKCAGNVSIQKVDSTGKFGTEYSYYSTLTPAGWYSDGGTVYAEGVSFAAGEGFIVQNTHSVGAKLMPKAPITAE